MNETAMGDQIPAQQVDQTATANGATSADEMSGVALASDEPSALAGATEHETAREVAANHLTRLLYTPTNAWSRYVFHENDPYPYGLSRPSRSRGQ